MLKAWGEKPIPCSGESTPFRRERSESSSKADLYASRLLHPAVSKLTFRVMGVKRTEDA